MGLDLTENVQRLGEPTILSRMGIRQKAAAGMTLDDR